MNHSAAVLKQTRKAWGLGLYRSLITLVLLVVGFKTFPGFEPFIAATVIAFNQGVAAIGQQMVAQFALQNDLDDAGERKTRWTVVVASRRARSDYFESPGYSLWNEVNDELEGEKHPPPAPQRLWQSMGLVLGNSMMRLGSDIVLVVFASFLSRF